MRFFYITVTAVFVQANIGRQSPVNPGSYFGYAITKNGEYVVSLNTANDFPGALDSFRMAQPDSMLDVRTFKTTDFPASEPIK